ncbi:MAG: TonB-dependent receptor [Bacteroidales bacterium]|jgi:iron complex outermembrane receptor protein|nr:TonB-dependent receptor [Bacteroidales bacterium]
MKKLLVLCGLILFPFCVKAQTSKDSDSTKIFNKLDSIVVSATRAGMNTPVAHTVIYAKELSNAPGSYSIPKIIALQPSVVATSEGGGWLGNTQFSIRGSDASRINITLNDIPLNNGESQSVFWVDVPSVQSYLQSAQIQRGAGTSVNGSAAFGASVNFQTLYSPEQAYGLADFTYGSYKTYTTLLGAGTGISKKGLSFDVRYSHGNTQGYIRNAKSDLNSLFATAAWQDKKNSLRLIYIYGSECTGITWEGISLDKYYSDRRYNVSGIYYDEAGNVHYYDNETDNYNMNTAQMLYTRKLGEKLLWRTVFNYTNGYGYYEDYEYNKKYSKYGLKNQTIKGTEYSKSDFIVRKKMNNNLYAVSSSLAYDNKKNLKAVFGLSYSNYDGNHYGNVIWSKYDENIPDNYRWYLNSGKKNDYSVFVRAEINITENLVGFADVQYRHIKYDLSGVSKDFADLTKKLKYDFFNPRAGLTFHLNDKNKIYASVGISHREPSRDDIKESIKAGTAGDIKSERLTDYELGYAAIGKRAAFSANLYYMDYKNQLVATGLLSSTGYTIKQNIPDSYRRGVELTASWRAKDWMRFDANLTLSENKLKNYTEYVETYSDPDNWNKEPQTPVNVKKSNLTLSPGIIGMAMVTVNPYRSLALSMNGKVIGRQYMDNLSDGYSKVPAYLVSGFMAAQTFGLKNGSLVKVSFRVDNLFNNRYYAYGWIYRARFSDGSDDHIERGVFPQAETNFTASVSFRF